MNAAVTAIYARVSSKRQDLRSQLPDLQRWEAGQDEPVRWYTEKHSGTKLMQPEWKRLEEDLRAGLVKRVVVWRLDRLGRTAAGLTALFEELRTRKLPLVSIRDGFDLSTPAGNMMAGVLASLAQYETEVRRERQAAGIEAAKAAGKSWGGRKKGKRYKVLPAVERQIRKLLASGESKAAVARSLQINRSTIYAVLG